MIVADVLVVVRGDTVGGQSLAEPLGVGIGDLAE